jgi:hypothetical protein
VGPAISRVSSTLRPAIKNSRILGPCQMNAAGVVGGHCRPATEWEILLNRRRSLCCWPLVDHPTAGLKYAPGGLPYNTCSCARGRLLYATMMPPSKRLRSTSFPALATHHVAAGGLCDNVVTRTHTRVSVRTNETGVTKSIQLP